MIFYIPNENNFYQPTSHRNRYFSALKNSNTISKVLLKEHSHLRILHSNISPKISLKNYSNVTNNFSNELSESLEASTSQSLINTNESSSDSEIKLKYN